MVLEIRILATSSSHVDWERTERRFLDSGNILYLDDDGSYTDVLVNRNVSNFSIKISSLYTFCT